MNRVPDQLFDGRIADWLEADPDTAPDQALEVVLAAIPSIRQRRRGLFGLGGWRMNQMTTSLKFAVGVAAVLVVAAGGLYLLAPRDAPGVGDPVATPTPSAPPSVAPSPSPSASATPTPIDPATWVPYTSERYGYSIAYPPTAWTATPGDHDWTLEKGIDASFNSTAPDRFDTGGAADGLGILLSVWSVTVDPGTTLEDWMEAYCVAEASKPCTDVTDLQSEVTPGGPSRILGWHNALSQPMAAFLSPGTPSTDAGTVYVAAIWRSENDPSVQPWGGSQRLLEAFLSTMTLPEAAPDGSPAAS